MIVRREPVVCMTLTHPPIEANQLVAIGDMLIAWQFAGILERDSDNPYHIAIYYHRRGWQAYRWDAEKGNPKNIIPLSGQTIWVDTDRGKILILHLEDANKAAIDVGLFGDALLAVEEDGCWVYSKTLKSIYKLEPVAENTYGRRRNCWIHNNEIWWAKLLGKEAIVAGNWRDLLILSYDDRHSLVCNETRSFYDKSRQDENADVYFCYCPPYIVKKEQGRLYYTKDPRAGWHTAPQLKMEDEGDSIKYIVFFGEHDGFYYVVATSSLHREDSLYRFSASPTQSEEEIAPVLTFSTSFLNGAITLYKGMMCLTKITPISAKGRDDVPENAGFLALDLKRLTFHADIPNPTHLHAENVLRSKLHLPAEWLAEEEHNTTSVFQPFVP